jgi:hypothetical protein
MSNTTILDKESNWLTDQLSSINYSSDKQTALLYELGLLRGMIAQLMHTDNQNSHIVKRIIQSSPYYKNKR